ncbi:MAG TPA: UDP-N-acetylmuramate dehydrogenase [Chitinophagales bacterium]|nr:UDP-N-acetylmuramate dehydrogenase [Chitinophagales bacterium]
MRIESNKSLQQLNTFGIAVTAKYFAEIFSPDEFSQLIADKEFQNEKRIVLGGGSNLLFTKNFDGLVIKNSLLGIEVLNEDAYHVWIKVAAGEVWHSFVMFCVERNLAGVENLSLIPGLVGAAPMQNIGAYGVEVKETCEEVEAIQIATGAKTILKNDDCEFGYRESVFKNKFKDQFFISSVTFKLNKIFKPKINYGDVRKTLEEMRADEITVKTVSDAVIKIRTSKLPDPKDIPNAGSFFKNPVVKKKKFEELISNYPLMPNYPDRSSQVKIPAGWLIEQCGWKGKRIGDAGVHAKQALVIVNYGDASGEEIFSIAQQVQKSVMEKFGIELQTEVNII